MKINNNMGGGISFNCDKGEERQRQTLCDKRDNNNV